MSVLLFVLSLLALLALLVALVKPRLVRLPSRKNALLILGGAFLVLFIGAIAMSPGPSSGPSQERQTTTPAPATPEQPARPEQAPRAEKMERRPARITASALFAAYDANEVAADQRYKGQVVEVSGTIRAISKDVFETPFVSFETENPFLSVHCYFDKADTPRLARLAKNERLAAIGEVSGKTLGSVIVKKCALQG